MSEAQRLRRTVRGRRPEFYPDPAADQLMSMVMVIAQEFTVLRDRVDTIERIADQKGFVLSDEIEHYVPDQAVLEARELRRQEFLERLFYLLDQKAAEASANDTEERFEKTIATIATS